MRKKKKPIPIFRLRSLLMWVGMIAVLIAGPLLLVWKQVYITSESMHIDKMLDVVAKLSKEQTELRLRCEQLAANERIERIARTSLGLDYPVSSQIVVIRVPQVNRSQQIQWPRELAAFIKRSLFGENG